MMTCQCSGGQKIDRVTWDDFEAWGHTDSFQVCPEPCDGLMTSSGARVVGTSTYN